MTPRGFRANDMTHGATTAHVASMRQMRRDRVDPTNLATIA